MSRFIVFGAGAVGGVVGGRLFQHGSDVVLVARGAHADALQRTGLRLQSADDDVTLPIPTVTHAREIDWRSDDVVLLGVKSQDTATAAAQLSATAPATVAVVSLQNGIANEPALLRWFADVYGMCVMAPTQHVEPGVVQANSTPIAALLDIGRYPHGVDARAEQIAAAVSASGMQSIPSKDIMRWKRTKLLMNLGNAVDACCAPSEAGIELVKRARREGVACFDAAGFDYASREEDQERRADLLTIKPIAGSLRGGGSTWQSLARGTGAVEADWLNGEIVRIGREYGVPTPVNALLRHVANGVAERGGAPHSVNAAELLSQL